MEYAITIDEYLNSLADDVTEIRVNCLSRIKAPIGRFPDLSRFKNVMFLFCSEFGITSFSNLPRSLVRLYCYGNKITSLPELPEGLIDLFCSSNSLTSLPKLPTTLQDLTCTRNFITILPELPSKLVELSCEKNRLTELPKLPDCLKILECSSNLLTILPKLPCRLKKMTCKYNILTTLPDLPSSLLKIMFCEGNRFIYPYKRGHTVEEINKINQILKKFRHLFYCQKLKPKFKKWLWERVRQKEAMRRYHPSRLALLLELEEKRIEYE